MRNETVLTEAGRQYEAAHKARSLNPSSNAFLTGALSPTPREGS